MYSIHQSNSKSSNFFSNNNEERFAAKSLFIHPYSVQISKFRLLGFGIDSFYCIIIYGNLYFLTYNITFILPYSRHRPTARPIIDLFHTDCIYLWFN